MSPRDVLVATTRSAAELLGVGDQRGMLEPGKDADFVVVDGDPYDLDALPDRIGAVYVGGARLA
jgi:imidazolonepropionase-like amidohydrolase